MGMNDKKLASRYPRADAGNKNRSGEGNSEMDQQTNRCPLCGNRQVRELEKINTKQLVKMYSQGFQVSILAEFAGCPEVSLNRCEVCDLIFYTPMITGSEDFYRQLQKFDWYYMDDKNEYDYAKNFIRASDDVLEIGCGKGVFSKKIAFHSYLGLEFSPEAIAGAKESGLCVLNESIERHAQKNANKYDVVFAFQVLEHIADIESFIKSCLACLKPDGILIFSVPSSDSFGKYAVNSILEMPPHHVTRWSDRALQNIGTYYHLDVVDIWHEPLQPAHKLFYAQTVFVNAFFRFFKISRKSIAVGLLTQSLIRASGVLARIFSYGMDGPEFLPKGISVTAIYKKK
jgi:2-polyprenyl-3-methyl-5-hydroxy-6-metoxy-1,4-benzoquinol methylase